ncbi:MAG TPA: flagellar biosynthesis protein FlgB [Planctomycetota bacterium]|nr:flagellar biosynthesis protein FlgB [Planctomycetota bacterium]
MEIHGTNDLLGRLLAAAGERSRVIATNLANENTPGYRRVVLRFEELLRGAMEKGDGDLSKVMPRLEEDLVTPARPDGNNVDLELEMNALRQNRLLYESYAAVLATRLEILRSSIESGR